MSDGWVDEPAIARDWTRQQERTRRRLETALRDIADHSDDPASRNIAADALDGQPDADGLDVERLRTALQAWLDERIGSHEAEDALIVVAREWLDGPS